jgi:hypothetical protein
MSERSSLGQTSILILPSFAIKPASPFAAMARLEEEKKPAILS